MDRYKRVVNAVAGSGKTSMIINQLTLNKRTAIITYTTSNQDLLKKNVISKFGFIPENIHIFGFWQFIYSFCLVPCLSQKPKGIIFDNEIKLANKFKNGKLAYGVKNYIFDNMISKFLFDKKIPYIERINEYFDEIYVDEMQDFDSFDFDWLLSLSKTNIKILLVGDFYQRTYSTSKFGNKSSAAKKDYSVYKRKFEESGYHFDETELNSSYRCTPEICNFVSKELGILITSHRDKDIGLISLIEDDDEIIKIIKNDSIKKLFLREHYKYDCNSVNWGDCKGQSYSETCVILNPESFKLYIGKKLIDMKPITKSKFYVACTRSLGNVYFIEQKKIQKFKK